MTMPFGHTSSSCTCCKQCEKHQINQKFGYVIPCQNKFNCPEFLQLQEEVKIAKQKEREMKQNDYAARESERQRFLKRKHK